MKLATLTLAAVLTPLWGQQIRLPANLEKLAARAEESVDITLDGAMLKLAARFLSDKDGDEARAKKLMGGLESIYVRSFEFRAAGAYSTADVDAVRAQFQAPAWSRIVGVRSNSSEGNVDVFVKNAANGQLGGVVILSAEPTELTFVSIVGTLDPEHLADLGGQFHIPRLAIHSRAGK